MPLWKPAAIADRKRITAYIAQDNPQEAIEMGDLLVDKANLLTQQPMLGRVGRVKGTRELVPHLNYILIYRLAAGTAEVLRVKHSTQQWPGPAKKTGQQHDKAAATTGLKSTRANRPIGVPVISYQTGNP